MALFLLVVWLAGCSGVSSTGAPSASTADPSPSAASSAVTPAATSVTGDAKSNWTTYHRGNDRNGYIANMADAHQLASAWHMKLDGAVYAEPLLVGGRLLVVTEGDSVYSLNAQTGQVQWRTNVGTPVPLSNLPCGNIDPLGITGTPVYDPQSGLVFAVAEVTGMQHVLVGVDAQTGAVKLRRVVDPPGVSMGAQQERAALALSQGMVYVAFGGLDGDCGDYHGWVVASRTDGQGSLLTFEVSPSREGGIWAVSGPAVDTAGHVYVAVGNGSTTQGNWDHTDSILRLSPTLQFEDGFAPTAWMQENAADADLGSMGPILLSGGLVYADGKGGQGYLLHANALGGVGGQAQVSDVCRAYGGSAAVGTTVFVPCTDGLREVVVGPGTQMSVGWHAAGQITSSPVVGGHTVYSLDPGGGTLYALDSASGNVVASVSVGAASRFTTPTLAPGRVYVGTMAGVVAVTIA